MSEVTSQDAQRGFSDLIARVRLNGERITITRFNRPAAVLVSVEDAKQLPPRTPPERRP